MTTHRLTPNRVTGYLVTLWLLPSAWAYTPCINGVCTHGPDYNEVFKIVAMFAIFCGIIIISSCFQQPEHIHLGDDDLRDDELGDNQGLLEQAIEHHNQAIEHHNQAMAHHSYAVEHALEHHD
ncbi:hypothetical protein DFH09DRAFT_1276941 [Mycena vulgaris]|nr:hypothetical protein DFH09DRAFT_1276941 [Mycena vulgaris]